MLLVKKYLGGLTQNNPHLHIHSFPTIHISTHDSSVVFISIVSFLIICDNHMFHFVFTNVIIAQSH